MSVMADDAAMVRNLQVMVGGAKAKGSVNGKVKIGGSVKAKVTVPKIKAKVTVPKIKAKVTVPKIKVKTPKVGLKIGSHAKTNGKLKIKIKTKKPKVKTHGKLKIKLGGKVKTHGKLKIKLGGKVKTHGKLKIKIGGKAHGNLKIKSKTTKKEAAKPTGTCPMAAKMGFKTTTAYTRNSRKACKSLKTTCCTNESLDAYAKKYKLFLRKSSKTLWTLNKIPTLVGVIMGNLSSSTCPGAASADLLAKNSATTTQNAIAAQNRILQRMRKRKTVRRKVRKPKSRSSFRGRKHKKSKLKFKFGTKSRGHKRSSGKIKIRIGGKTHYRVRHRKTKFKIRIRRRYVAHKGFENKVAPKDFLNGTRCRANFDTTYKMLYGVNHARKAVAVKSLGCFKALAQLRGELSCAVCDNTKEAFFSNSSSLNVQPGNLAKLGQCIMFIRYLKKYQEFLNQMLDFVGVLGKDVTAAKSTLSEFEANGTEGCEGKANAEPVADNTTGNKTASVKVAVKTKKRLLQVVVKPTPQTPANTQAQSIFEWDLATIIGKSSGNDKWNKYIKMPQALPETNIAMTNACMNVTPFSRIWNGVMFGDLNE